MGHDCCYGFHASVDGGLMKALAHAAQHQAKAIQLFLGDAHRGTTRNYLPEELRQFALEKVRRGIQVVVHHNYVTNLSDPKGKLAWAQTSAKQGLRLAEQIGADFFVIHNGSHNGSSMEEGIRTLHQSMVKLLSVNAKPVICMENGAGGGTQVGHLDNLIKIVKSINDPRLRICLDTAHLWADGVDMTNGYVRKDVFQKLVPWLGMVHWNNPDPNVAKGGHLDRHKVSWSQGAWKPKVMEAIAQELNGFPLIMEASGEAVEANFEYLRAREEERLRAEANKKVDSLDIFLANQSGFGLVPAIDAVSAVDTSLPQVTSPEGGVEDITAIPYKKDIEVRATSAEDLIRSLVKDSSD